MSSPALQQSPSAPPDSPPPEPKSAFGWRYTAPLLTGSSLNPINSSMIATGLVGIGADFHKGPGTTAMLISVLYLCSAIMQPTMGKLATLFGARRVFLTGVAILLLGGIVGAAAPAFGFLLVSRALIGIGTSAAYPTAMALVRKRSDELGTGVPSRVLGNFSIASQVTLVIGLPLGGVLAGAFGWRALFLVNLPLALFTLALTLYGVPKDGPSSEARGDRSLFLAVDVPGIALFAGTIGSMLIFLAGLTDPVWWLLAASVVLGAALVAWERRAPKPLVDVRMLARNTRLLRTYVRQMLASLGVYIALYGTSQWMEDAGHYSASQVGLLLLPLSAVSILIARVVSDRGWVRVPLILTGICLVATGIVMFAITHTSGVVALIGMSLLFGLANGFSGYANQAALYTQSAAGEIAVASGLYRTFVYIGAIFSSSLIGIAFGHTATDSGLHVIAGVILGIGVLIAFLAALDRAIPSRAAD